MASIAARETDEGDSQAGMTAATGSELKDLGCAREPSGQPSFPVGMPPLGQAGGSWQGLGRVLLAEYSDGPG